jgi:hypothetical protein
MLDQVKSGKLRSRYHCRSASPLTPLIVTQPPQGSLSCSASEKFGDEQANPIRPFFWA